jgi:hypothetical protein
MGMSPDWGACDVVVVSQLTDPLSGPAYKNGTTERGLRLLLDHTKIRLRMLSKNAALGLVDKWARLMADHPGRFVAQLSIGTLDDTWARAVEKRTPPPTSRVRATRALQDAGIPTAGMLCPIFADAMEGEKLDALVDAIRPTRCETVWAEPFNDRACWEDVAAGYAEGSFGRRWLKQTFGPGGDRARWSAYATELYVRLRDKARREGWLDRMIYLLYEGDITDADAAEFKGFEGVLLQGGCETLPGPVRQVKDKKTGAVVEKPSEIETGWSKHPAFKRLQRFEGDGYMKRAFPRVPRMAA